MGTKFYSATENAIEWITGEDRITVTLSDKKLINTVKRLAKKYKDEVEILALPSNNDGYLYAHLPLTFLRLQVPANAPELTDEQKDMLRDRVASFRDKSFSRTAGENEAKTSPNRSEV